MLRLTTTHPFLSTQLCDSWRLIKCGRIPALLRVIHQHYITYLSANKNNCIITWIKSWKSGFNRYVHGYIRIYVVLLQGIILSKENVCIQRKCVHTHIKSLYTSFFGYHSRRHTLNESRGCKDNSKIHFVVQFNDYT